jgi:elongation factor G
MGANPWKPIADMRSMLRLNAAAVQIPIGAEDRFEGVVDLVQRKAYYFDGAFGEVMRTEEVPADLVDFAEEKRTEMIEHLANVDDEVGEVFLNDEEPSIELLKAAIRRQVIATQFVPVFMGTAFKNKGVQALMDGVVDYLPDPSEITNKAIDNAADEATVTVQSDENLPLVALAFKLEESRFGQLTYLRVYQGTIRKGDTIMNVTTGKKLKVPRLVRMNAAEMEDLTEAPAGEIVALFGVDCHSGTTFTDGELQYSMNPIHVPEPVISLAIQPKLAKDTNKFAKALQRFVKEDPTFRLHQDQTSGQTIISGMGELHLEIYCERIRREYDCEVIVGNPKVNYRETITQRAEFNYLHKKQSGGSGQFARVIGYIEPIDTEVHGFDNKFVNGLSGNNVPPEYVPAINKGFEEITAKGPNTGCVVQGVKFTVTDGAAHVVDSSEIAFRLATINGIRHAYPNAGPVILEPVMDVQIEIPEEHQGNVVGELTRRKGQVSNVESRGDGYTVIDAEVPLSKMFGYATDLRSMTQGKGEFTMTYRTHQPILDREEVQAIADKYKASRKDDDEMM